MLAGGFGNLCSPRYRAKITAMGEVLIVQSGHSEGIGGRPPQHTKQMTEATTQTNALPPQMQDRIAQIITNAQANASGEVPAETEAELDTSNESVLEDEIADTELSLMNHLIALRREVCAMRNELHAISQVTDAVGQAVGQMYAKYSSK